VAPPHSSVSRGSSNVRAAIRSLWQGPADARMTAVGDALKPIEAVALDNDLRAILECMIAGIHVDGRRSAANRVAVVVLAAWTGTNSRAYWNFESSSLQRRVCKPSVPSEHHPDPEGAGAGCGSRLVGLLPLLAAASPFGRRSHRKPDLLPEGQFERVAVGGRRSAQHNR